ncbi:MAG: heat-inducible transcriptional repressor HrcA [Acholeplasmatales bacterium]|nr:heat-inducible transcriptional repressor HrcA [Acholeplasmatales bacterium]
MLTDRQKLILKAIIEEYVTSNEPVGSKSLTEKPYLTYSSATIRYEMQHLEEIGYLKKTHTSSGRIPSEIGYRYYVDHLVIRDEYVSEYFKYVDEILDNKMLSKEEAIKKLTNFLSELTGYYTAIIGTSSDLARVLKMEIVPLEEHNEAVLLIVTSIGTVQSQKIYIPDGYKMDDLMRIISMFDNAMYGRSIYEIRDVLSKEAAKPRIRQMVDFQDDILNFMIKSFEKFLKGETYDAGLSKLFSQPEFQDREVIQKVIKAINEEVTKSFGSQEISGIKIHIGSENLCSGLEECSIITIPYAINDNENGTILLVGPTRMNYRATIPLLEYVAYSMKKLDKR